MRWCCTALALLFASCAVELDDIPGRACDALHPCRAPRACVLGTCRDPLIDGGTDPVDAGVDAGMTADAGQPPDAGVARWLQKIHGFSTTDVEPGCMLDIDPLRGNRVFATIRSATDAEDRAEASMVDPARLPRGTEGRFRGRVTLAAPLQLGGFVPFAFVGTQSGLAFARVGFDGQGRLRVESDPQTVAGAAVIETFGVDGGFQAGDWIIDVAWRAGASRQVRINDVLVGDQLVTGGASTPPNELSLGPARYDGTATQPFSLTLSSWQLADELSVVLNDP